jgi:hypothetical protein
VLFFCVFVGSSVHSSLIANFLPIWTPYTTYMACTTYTHALKHRHCHSKKRDVKRRHRLSVAQAPGREAGAHARRREDDNDDGLFVSKMKGASFLRRPPRTHCQCTHTLCAKYKENDNLQ